LPKLRKIAILSCHSIACVPPVYISTIISSQNSRPIGRLRFFRLSEIRSKNRSFRPRIWKAATLIQGTRSRRRITTVIIISISRDVCHLATYFANSTGRAAGFAWHSPNPPAPRRRSRRPFFAPRASPIRLIRAGAYHRLSTFSAIVRRTHSRRATIKTARVSLLPEDSRRGTTNTIVTGSAWFRSAAKHTFSVRISAKLPSPGSGEVGATATVRNRRTVRDSRDASRRLASPKITRRARLGGVLASRLKIFKWQAN